MSNSKLPALDPTIVLVILRVTLGALFVSTFFENLGKDLYGAQGYAGLIRSYIKYGHAPTVWKQVMGFTAAHAAIAGPLQGVLEPSLGVLLILGFFSRPAALVAFGFLTGLWVSEWGIGWIWELLVPMVVAAALTLGPSGQRAAVDVALARRWPQLTI
ncbi:MAG: DoxX family membrane protein [Deltaproteobacteria bacterium]|nr:DoxX family membrane protein [Deltaproteobacteria bacterium]